MGDLRETALRLAKESDEENAFDWNYKPLVRMTETLVRLAMAEGMELVLKSFCWDCTDPTYYKDEIRKMKEEL